MYEILLSHEAEKQYDRLPPEIKRKINKCIDGLSDSPLSGPNIKKLHGELEGKLRCRAGSYRIIYAVDSARKIVKIFAIGSRGDVYKK